MLSQSIGKLSSPNDLPFQIIVGCSLGSVFGIASRWISPLLLFGILAAALLIYYTTLKRPEFVLLGILVLTSTIINFYSIPPLPIGIGRLIITDIALLIPLGIIFLRVMIEKGFKFIHTPLDLPLLCFYGIAILFTVIAIFQSSITFNQSLGEMRILSFYLTFFIITNLIRDEQRLRRLLNGIMLLSTLVALAMIAQYLLGEAIRILPGRVETLGTAGITSEGVSRVLPPGQTLVMVGFFSLIVLTIVDRTQPISMGRFFQIAILGFSVLLTFNRNFWIGIGLALFIMACLVPIPDKLRLIKMAILGALLGGIVLVSALISIRDQSVKLINASLTRMATLFNPETLKEESLRYRYIENSYALPQIASHPLVGLGLGAHYRPLDLRIDRARIMTYDKLSYIHNGHLWVLLKTGLIGYVCLLWVLFLHIKRGVQKWRRVSDPFMRGIVLSFSIMIIAILAAAFVSPLFCVFYWTPVIGIMLGTNEVILRKLRME